MSNPDRAIPPVLSCHLTAATASPTSLMIQILADNRSDEDWYCDFGSGNDTYELSITKFGAPVDLKVYGYSYQDVRAAHMFSKAAGFRMATFVPARHVDKCDAELGRMFAVEGPGQYDVRAARLFWTLSGGWAELETHVAFTVASSGNLGDLH